MKIHIKCVRTCCIVMLSHRILDIPDCEKKSPDNMVGPLLGYLAATHGFGSKEIKETGHSCIVMLSHRILDIPDCEKKSPDNMVGPLLGYLAVTHGFGSKEIIEAGHSTILLAPELTTLSQMRIPSFSE